MSRESDREAAALLSQLPTELLDHLAEAIADRLVERLQQGLAAEPGSTLLDAKEVARRCGRSRDWVYAHSAELGAIHLGDAGDGKRPRLAFDPVQVDAYLAPQRAVSVAVASVQPAPSRARRVRRGEEDKLLPIRGGAG